AQPVAGQKFISITSVDVADDDGAHACAANCLIKAGDVLTFSVGQGMEGLGHEVHFVFFEPERDYAVSVLEWKEDAKKLSVQMPHLGPEVFDKPGAIFIGTASAPVTSVFWGFKYDPTITLFLPMDMKLLPKVWSSSKPDHADYE